MHSRRAERPNNNAAPSKEALLRQAADLQRQQAEVRAKMAELAELVQDLSEEERAELQQHIQCADAGLAATAQVQISSPHLLNDQQHCMLAAQRGTPSAGLLWNAWHSVHSMHNAAG